MTGGMLLSYIMLYQLISCHVLLQRSTTSLTISLWASHPPTPDTPNTSQHIPAPHPPKQTVLRAQRRVDRLAACGAKNRRARGWRRSGPVEVGVELLASVAERRQSFCAMGLEVHPMVKIRIKTRPALMKERPPFTLPQPTPTWGHAVLSCHFSLGPEERRVSRVGGWPLNAFGG